jgi:AraC-like DNA-binding protein
MGADLQKLHQLCRLRSHIEAFALAEWRKARDPSIGPDSVGLELQDLLEQLQQFAMRGDYPAFHQVDRRFHRHLVSACGMDVLVRSWELVVAELDPWISHVQQVYWPSLMSLYREHVFLLEAWNSPDDWVAAEATHQHLEAGWYRLASAHGEQRPEIDPVDRAASFISTHYASQLDVKWIASHVSFVSASHLNRLFRQKMGTSPKAYIRRVRLERAAQLLASTAQPVARIARQVGYKNASHFIRDFRSVRGMTPLLYRSSCEPTR